MTDPIAISPRPQQSPRHAVAWALVLSSMISTPVMSAATDISSSPITTLNAAQVKPNIMLLMDTSYSTGWSHMPDEVESQVGFGAIGYKATQCNILYYNRDQKYDLPKKADGTFWPIPSFTTAPYDAFKTPASANVDLSAAFKAYDDVTLRFAGDNDTPQPAYYWYKTGGTVPITGYASSPCNDPDPAAMVGQAGTVPSSDSGVWRRVLVNSGSGVGGVDERTNFAIWYSYYRTRILLIKSAASLAFTPLTDSFRVGFITVRPKDDPTTGGPINAEKYLPIDDFTSIQRGLWYDKLFAQKAAGSSPTREGLARVGRHYAGKHDGINEGMTGDPVQFSCQQNFTIMTTDGYWNGQEESINLPGGYLGGGVDMSGKSLVGQQDGDISNPLSPRPIWDGQFDGTRTVKNKTVHYEYLPCGNYFNMSTSTVNKSTSQLRAQTVQTTQTTVQNLQSTSQNLQSTLQTVRSTSQPTQSTFQTLKSTQQNLASSTQRVQTTAQTTESAIQYRKTTNQNLRSTTQNLQTSSQTLAVTTRVDETVWIPQQSTTQNLQSTTQTLQSTSQQNQGTVQNLETKRQNLYTITYNGRNTSQTVANTAQTLQGTEQNLQSTSQTLRRTTQTLQSTSQVSMSTLQLQQSTVQNMLVTSKTTRSTFRDNTCNAAGENCVPVQSGSCTPGAGVTCVPTNTGPTLVVYMGCTPQTPEASNSWTTVTCNTVTQPAQPAASCAFDPATAGNGYTTTTCPSPNTTGPTPVATCNAATAGSGNAYTTTSCSNNATGPVYVASCASQAADSSNSYTATTCATNSTGPVGVQTCSPQTANSGNSYLTIICASNNTPDTGVQTCSASSGDAGNSWVTTVCTPVTTSNVPVATCTTSAATAANDWKATSCVSNVSTTTAVASCVPVAADSGNSYTATVCTANNNSTPSGTCAPSGPTGANSYTTTTCPTVTGSTPLVPYGTCTPATASSVNAYTTTTCPQTVDGPMPYSAACFSPYVGGTYYYYQCAPNDSVSVPVATCNPSGPDAGNGYTTTTCAVNASGLTPVAACAPIAADAGNFYTATICPVATTTNVGVASCVPEPTPNAGNSYTTTTCAPNNTSNVPVASCANSGPSSGNGYTNTVCSTNNTSNVAVASCTPSTANSGNGWTTTTCPPEVLFSGPTPNASCTPTPATGPAFHRTDCTTVVTGTAVQAGTCVPDPPNGITCTTVTDPDIPVATCTPQTAAAGNNWTTITCGTNNTTNVPVATCAASGPDAGNGWTTTTCPAPVTTGPDFVASCSVVPADAGNSYTSTACPAPVTSGPTGVQTCAFIPGDAGNNWKTTTCGSAGTTMSVQTCTASAGDTGNAWTTTTCADNNSLNQPVIACSAQTAASGNGWTTITCPPPIVTTNQPAATCVDDPTPRPDNSFTTTTCSANNVLNTPSGSCMPIAPDLGNNYTTTTCPVLTTAPIGASTCGAQTGDGSNGWLTVTCAPNNTSNVGVASCAGSGPTMANGYTTTSCTTASTTNVAVATCSAGSPTSANSYVTTTCSTNNLTNAPVESCSPVTPDASNGYTTTTCPVIDSGVIGAASCAAGPATMANQWTTTTCPGTATTGPAPSDPAACATQGANSGNSYTATTCTTTTSVPTVVTTCNPSPATAANGYVATVCTNLSGNQLNTTTTSRTQEFEMSGSLPSRVISDVTDVVGPVASGACYAPASQPALPADGPATWTTADGTSNPSCTAWPCTVDVNSTDPRSINSLADVAQYYYVTDLRTAANEPRGPDFYRNDVPSVGALPENDGATWQHMTTFSIGLGVSGTLAYRADYKSASTGDFAQIRTGPKNWPLWPDPSLNFSANATFYNDPRSIDDFWHAAVNGRGTYFSAANPTSVIAGLAGALAGIDALLGSSGGAAASNLEPVSGDNFAYLANYTTKDWTGDVLAREINTATGVVGTTNIWSAKTLLDATTSLACDNRRVMLFRSGAVDNLVDFTWDTSACNMSGNPTGPVSNGLDATERSNFAAANVNLLSQWFSMTDGSGGTPNQRATAVGANLVNFLRGQRGLEDYTSGVADKIYRKREGVLGDIVNAQPVYVRAPFGLYSDAGFTTFKSDKATRTPMLYVAANDGMLHAFYAGTSATDPQGGKEAWAIIPTAVLPKLYKLADANYRNVHEYFVDGTPAVSDVLDGSTWKTMLVAGLNSGGRGYYAVDVTNPTAPKGMWEFNFSSTCYDPANAASFGGDCHLGQTFGKPVISKLKDGRWVVMVTSGYNNVRPSPGAGDGVGYLYVLNAVTGQIVYKLSTGVGDATTPSGLAQINNYVEKAEVDNTTVRLYGTDVIGNVWRFDVNNSTPPTGREAVLVGTAKDGAGTPQPITVRPELTAVGGQPMIFVATGKLLGATDTTDLQAQSIYGFVDPITPATAFPNLRSTLAPLRMTQVGSGASAYRTVNCIGTTAQCGSADGWYIDLPDGGERVNVEMKLRKQTLVIGSNVPSIGACVAGGYGWLNFLDYKSGLAVTGSPDLSVSVSVTNSLIVGLTIIILPPASAGGPERMKAIVTTADGRTPSVYAIPHDIGQGTPRRISWREVLAQ